MVKFVKQAEVLPPSPDETLSLGGELALVIRFGNAITLSILNHREINYGCKYWRLACYWLSTSTCGCYGAVRKIEAPYTRWSVLNIGGYIELFLVIR